MAKVESELSEINDRLAKGEKGADELEVSINVLQVKTAGILDELHLKGVPEVHPKGAAQGK